MLIKPLFTSGKQANKNVKKYTKRNLISTKCWKERTSFLLFIPCSMWFNIRFSYLNKAMKYINSISVISNLCVICFVLRRVVDGLSLISQCKLYIFNMRSWKSKWEVGEPQTLVLTSCGTMLWTVEDGFYTIFSGVFLIDHIVKTIIINTRNFSSLPFIVWRGCVVSMWPFLIWSFKFHFLSGDLP